MKKRFSIKIWLVDSFEQLLQLALLFFVMLAPFRFDFQATLELKQPDADIQQVVVYYVLQHGNVCISISLAVLMIFMFHKINADKVLNVGNRYHRRTMFGYWLYSRVLGYKKCSLIRVPIANQFKLILSDLFSEYDVGQCEEANADEYISVRKYGTPMLGDLLLLDIQDLKPECNLDEDDVYIAISDTYPITEAMLPDKCNGNNTLIIQREANKEDSTRYKSKALTKMVLNVLRHIDNEIVVHVLPVTNVNNTYGIVNNVFKTGGQDNIKHLYVHPQPHAKEDGWKFSDEGVKIY